MKSVKLENIHRGDIVIYRRKKSYRPILFLPGFQTEILSYESPYLACTVCKRERDESLSEERSRIFLRYSCPMAYSCIAGKE